MITYEKDGAAIYRESFATSAPRPTSAASSRCSHEPSCG